MKRREAKDYRECLNRGGESPSIGTSSNGGPFFGGGSVGRERETETARASSIAGEIQGNQTASKAKA